ncbi:MAG: Nif3-like dinuclear metal center hexameric protein [Neisseria sp.]|nr:Nif3-like dinuclear metal center hexameric protein [Neisseria sp.]
MAERQEILDWCDRTLQTAVFKDYAPNGLQVEGSRSISKILTSVTASLAAIRQAAEQGADMLLVHHGMFWKSEPLTVTGWKKERIAALLKHDINLAGYHLPLDAHPELGNNARLAAKLGLQTEYTCGDQNLLHIGRLQQPKSLADFAAEIERQLQRKPVIVGNSEQILNRVAWCTGGAQGFFQAAIDNGAEIYITGEISEAQYHLANETGAAFISAGHHATERYGIRALGEAVAAAFDVEVEHFDEENPA